jgi:hypothetical protein
MRALSERRAQEQADQTNGSEHAPAGAHLRWSAREMLGGLVLGLAGVPVAFRATDATRAAAIRSVLGRISPSSGEPVAHFTFGSHRVPTPNRPADEHQADVVLWHDDDALSVACGPTVGGRVQSDHASLGGYSPNLSQLFNHVAPFMLASLLGPHGRFLLHGGAIQRDGEAVLVLGDSGVGKSTLIFGALDAGWNVLSDDLVVIHSQASGPEVSGIPKSLAVPDEILGNDRRSSALGMDGRGRRELAFEDWDRGSYPVKAVVVVAHGDEEHTRVEAIESSLLLALLLRGMLSRQPSIVRGYVRSAIALCARPACRLLHSGTAEARAPQAAEAVAAHLRAAKVPTGPRTPPAAGC